MSNIIIRNSISGEEKKMYHFHANEDGSFSADYSGKANSRFYSNWPQVSLLNTDENGVETFTLAEGWEIVKVTNKKRQRRVSTPAEESVVIEEPAVIEEPVVVETTPTPETFERELEIAKTELSYYTDREKVKAELLEKYGVMGAEIFEAAAKYADTEGIDEARLEKKFMARMIDEVNARINAEKEALTQQPANKLEVVSPQGVNVVNGKTAKNFAIYCNLVQAGKPLYMYGPAGCGKSYTAKQIAEALGFDYYETSQAMFAHELKGYGDAAGRFVETSFYRAFVNGGVFFLDEVDASAPEALVVLNNAIANKRFDFPVIGNVEAHPNFRVIAAGNTRMTGATIEYTARQMQDTSFKNRFFFEVVTYDREVMLDITGGDEEIVNFGADLRRAARRAGISQLFSYRQAADLATLQAACLNDDAHLLRGSVLQEKEVDDVQNLYAQLDDKNNRWAKAMKACINEMTNEEVW